MDTDERMVKAWDRKGWEPDGGGTMRENKGRSVILGTIKIFFKRKKKKKKVKSLFQEIRVRIWEFIQERLVTENGITDTGPGKKTVGDGSNFVFEEDKDSRSRKKELGSKFKEVSKKRKRNFGERN